MLTKYYFNSFGNPNLATEFFDRAITSTTLIIDLSIPQDESCSFSLLEISDVM